MTGTRTRSEDIRSLGGARAVVLGLFLFSGVSGLIYEVVWSRMFALVLGTTVYAVATVLGVFMGGLALGSWLFGGFADRPGANGLRIYAWLELGIGVFALVLPWLMDLSDVIYRAVWPAVSDSFAWQMLLRLVLAGMILLVPSTMMGGTLPVLSRFLVRSRERTGREIGTLYAINTLGAVLGCFFAGFFLLERLGIGRTLLAAAVLNFLVGGTALLCSRRVTVGPVDRTYEEAPLSVRRYSPAQIRLALILYAFSGFAALALEVLWTRGLMYFTSVDTWAFTAMLSAFLCGLGLGSLVTARFVGRVSHPLLVLGVIEVLVGVSAAASIPLFERLHGAFITVAGAFPGQASLFAKIVTKLFASFFIMLVPTLLMGAAFPLVSAVYVGARRRVGRGIGTLYALNTVGAIVGSVAAGFLLIPVFGVERAILLCASVFVVLGLVLCAAAPRSGLGRIAGVASALVGVVVLLVVNLGFAGGPIVYQSRYFKSPDPNQRHKVLFCHEGAAATLAVLENPAGTKLLNINGVTTAINNYMDMQVHRMLSHLPILLHPDPKTVLVVGFGMGSTPWGCCRHDVDQVDVVELLRSEKQTAPIFADINHGVLDDPKLNFIEGDGRNYLLATRRAYDVISFNAIHPRFSANLYTEDFYRLCRERMSPDGVICAWLTQNSMKEIEFRMLCRSFVEVFPNSSLWYCNPEHFCLVGTMKPTKIDLDDWRKRTAIEAVRSDLKDSNLDDPFVLVGRYLLGGESLLKYVAGAPLNTDDRPRIEFARETKAEERLVIERLIELSQSVVPLVEFASQAQSTRDQLDRYEQATEWLAKGQMEYWYAAPGSLKPEIAYRRALLLAPDNHDVRHNLAFSKTVKHKTRQLLESDPDHVGALTRMGAILLEEGRLEQAAGYLVRALRIQEGFVPAAERLGFVHLFRGNLDQSVAWLGGVVRVKPQDARLLYAFSVALERQGRTGDAAAARERALASQPDIAEWFDLFERTVSMMKQHAVP